MRRLLAALLFGLWTALAGAADDLVRVPALAARVTDLTGTLSDAQKASLEAGLAGHEQRKGSQIAVLMLPTTQPESIEQFGIRLAEAWKIGRKGVDDGVILIVAKEDRRLRIEVGYGLEGVMGDAVANRIIGDVILPHFKRGDYFGGLEAGTGAIMRVIGDEALPAPGAQGKGSEGGADDSWLVWLAAAVVFASLARSLLGIVGSFGAAGLAGFLAFGAFGVLAAVAAAIAVFLLSFVPLSFLLHAAGGFGRGSRSGGLGGGFGGGGGGFGGGGASGRW